MDLVDQSVYDIRNLNTGVYTFEDRAMISFKVKAYSFEHLMHEQLACEQVEFTLTYNLPKGNHNQPIPISYECTEVNGAINYTISFSKDADIIILENS